VAIGLNDEPIGSSKKRDTQLHTRYRSVTALRNTHTHTHMSHTHTYLISSLLLPSPLLSIKQPVPLLFTVHTNILHRHITCRPGVSGLL
jgi:hypothetical protein